VDIKMSVGAWDPNQSAESDTFTIDQTLLQEFISLSEKQLLDNLSAHLTQAKINQQIPLMTQAKERWWKAAEPLSTQQINHLIRFFTVAEMQLSGWEAGSESPVVWLAKVLRQRKQPLEKEQLLWIRAHSDNRFLPNGAL